MTFKSNTTSRRTRFSDARFVDVRRVRPFGSVLASAAGPMVLAIAGSCVGLGRARSASQWNRMGSGCV